MDVDVAGVLPPSAGEVLAAVAGALLAMAVEAADVTLDPLAMINAGAVLDACAELCEGKGFGSSCGGGSSPLLG